jgi:hypothetical protein
MNLENLKAGFANTCLRVGVYAQSGMSRLSSHLLKLVAGGAAIILVFVGQYSVNLDGKYLNYTREPLPHHGMIIPYTVKGLVVYITKDERAFLSWITWIQVSSAVVAVIATLIDRYIHKKGRT